MKSVIITGGAQGIGYYTVKQLLKDGYAVTVLDTDISPLSALCAENASLLAIKCDVRSQSEVSEAVAKCAERFGSIDCAIHNACRCTFDSMENTSEEVYRDVFDVNYFGALHLTRAVVPHMKKQGGGRVMFTSSGVGVTGFINISPYASTKGALESLAKCLRVEYAKDGISFHIIHPPLTRTKSSAPLPIPEEFKALPETVGTGLAKRINVKRFIICHSAMQKLQTLGCYLFPIKMGAMMSKMTAKCMDGKR